MSNRVSIKQLQTEDDSARIYKWDVTIQFGAGTIDGISERINIRCSSIDVPNPTHSVIDVNVRGFTKKESGAVDWNPITLTCYEVQDYTILQELYALGQTQFDYETGIQEDKASYSSPDQGILINMNSLNDSIPMSWQMYGCILETYTPPQMTGDKAGIVELPFTVSFDYAQIV